MPAHAALGRLRFDLDALVLYDGSRVVPLPPLPARILVALVRADGAVVGARALREALWGDAAVEERNLNQQIYVLRRVLQREPGVSIENLPRRGYRLVVAAATAVRRSGLIRAALLAAAAVVSVGITSDSAQRPAQPQATPAAAQRDLALASYLLTSEGPGHLERAAGYYRALIDASPVDAEGFGGLALVDAKTALEGVGNARVRSFESARREAEAALKLDARQSDALTALGIVASVYEHQLGIAGRDFDTAVAADPTAESPRAWRGKFRLSIGDFRGAGCDFRTVSMDDPTSGSAVGLFGEWLVLGRDYIDASAVLSQALDLGYHPGFTRYWLARAYHQRGLDAQALRLSNQVLTLYPGEASALALRLRVESSLGDKQAALADLAQIERIHDPGKADPIALASADIAMGKRGAARATLERFERSSDIGLDEIARIRTDPDFDSLRNGFNSATL
jgi:DNA-binding winged helix-turn-helix (wHTH) protein/Tfp pilus assembly protein PilF